MQPYVLSDVTLQICFVLKIVSQFMTDCFVYRYLLNPRLTSSAGLEQLRFLGILLGVAVRTKKPLDLYLAPLVWKLLAAMPLSVQDLEEVDLLFVQNVRGIADIDESGVTEETFSEVRALSQAV